MQSLSEVIAAAVSIAARGVPVFPCHADTKRPACARGFYGASLAPESLFRAVHGADSPLIGVPTGAASGLMAIDIDPKKGGDIWWRANSHRFPPTQIHATRGTGGLHILYKHVPGMSISGSRVAPGVDVRAEGGYVVWWPAHGFPKYLDEPLAECPAWFVALESATRTPVRSIPANIADLAAPSALHVTALLRQMPNPDETDRDAYIRVMLAAKGCMDGLEAIGLDGSDIPDAACAWAAKWHASPGADAERAKWDGDFATRDAPLAGWESLQQAARVLIPGYGLALAQAEFQASPLPEPEYSDSRWRTRLHKNKEGDPISGVANVLVALTYAPDWRGVLGYDDFAGKLALTGRPPWEVGHGAWPRREITDVDITHAAAWLQRAGVKVASGVTAEGMAAMCQRRKFHPVREELAALKWDGKPRLDTWLIAYAGVEDTPLHRAYAAKFVVAMVARVRQPGCKHDVILLIEGAQGLLKSTMLRIMAGVHGFIDHMPDLASKDAALQLRGIWILEIAEFDKLERADAAIVKAWLSTQVDRIRVPYGRLAEDTPRQSVVAGTINPGDSGYLGDDTGNRRMWTVAAGVGWPPSRKIDIAGLKAVRSQIFAEAVARYEAGESWWLDSEDLDAAQSETAAARMKVDAWQGVVEDYLDGKDETSVSEILSRVLNKPAGQWNQADMNRVARVLKAAGWSKYRVDTTRPTGGGEPGPGPRQRAWTYRRPWSAKILPFRGPSGPSDSEFPTETRTAKIPI